MENASKALLIAGAILLVLSIITIGVFTFGKSKGFVNTMDKKLSKTDIENHNAQFKRFEGIVSGAEVKNACTLIARTNENNKLISMKMEVYNKNKIIANLLYTYSRTNDQMNKIMNEIENTAMFEGSYIYNSEGIIETLEFVRQ